MIPGVRKEIAEEIRRYFELNNNRNAIKSDGTQLNQCLERNLQF